MPNSSGAVDLGSLSTEEQDAVQRLADREAASHPAPEPEKSPEDAAVEAADFDTAFVVVLTHDGQFGVVGYEGPATIKREPTQDIIFGAVSTVAKDLSAAETAGAVMRAQMETMRTLQQQQQAAALQQQLAQRGGIRQ